MDGELLIICICLFLKTTTMTSVSDSVQ